MKWYIIYYKEGNNEPVKQFIDAVPVKAKVKILRNLQLLSEFGVELGYPLVSNVDRNIWELRTIYQGNQYRILFSIVSGQLLLLTHGFKKKTQRILDRDKELAIKRLKSYLAKGDN